MNEKYLKDREKILSHRQDNGGDYWATSDGRLMVGAPFSTLESAHFLLELGMPPDDPILQEVAGLFFSALREDGRFQLSAKGAIYPCHTAHALRLLCYLGYAADERLAKTFQHLLEIQYHDGGIRCNKFSFGRGPDTEYSNPFPTLVTLDAFRFTPQRMQEKALNKAVDFLLEHWIIKRPIGPCQYGIGSLFMQVEYPFRTYNLFYYVYVLSFYERAKNSLQFLEALAALESKMTDGQIVVQRVVPKLAKLNFCKKGEPTELGTERYNEIISNLAKA